MYIKSIHVSKNVKGKPKESVDGLNRGVKFVLHLIPLS